jgi:hypothetical protein
MRGARATADDPLAQLEAFRSEVKKALAKAAENIEDPILKQAVQVDPSYPSITYAACYPATLLPARCVGWAVRVGVHPASQTLV